MTAVTSDQVTAVILAGGMGSRLGGKNKCLLPLGQAPLIEHIITQLSGQCRAILISANRDITQLVQYGDVITDEAYPQQGPLSGIYQGLRLATTPYIITLPADIPAIPENYIARMMGKLNEEQYDLCVATDRDGKVQPVYALIPTLLADNLEDSLQKGHNKTMQWLSEHKPCFCQFDDPQDFFNINTPSDLDAMIQQTP